MSALRAVRRALLALCLLALPLPAVAAHVNVITVDGTINPASSDYIQKGITRSEGEGAAALVLQLDTPGGLLSSTKDIVQAILSARVPVIVFVSPRGAWAASAGTFITLAAHVAAMAPGTSIGAASPISAGGGGGERGEDQERQDVAAEKAERFTRAFIESIAKERKRNVEWAAKAVREADAITADEAVEIEVIDLVAEDRADLLAKAHGRTVQVRGEERTLQLEGAAVRIIAMPMMPRLFHFLPSPDVAVLLVMIGMLGLYIEFNQPGMLVPGIVGAVCLVLAAIAFQILPFSWVGLLLIVVGLGLLVAEIFVTSYGLLFTAGLGLFLLGGAMLFEVPEATGIAVSFWTVLVPAVFGFAVFGGLVVYALGRSFTLAQVAGTFELVGQVGRCDTPIAPRGRVFVRGEYWTAESDEEIAAGEPVEVTAVDGMRLRVRRAQAVR